MKGDDSLCSGREGAHVTDESRARADGRGCPPACLRGVEGVLRVGGRRERERFSERNGGGRDGQIRGGLRSSAHDGVSKGVGRLVALVGQITGTCVGGSEEREQRCDGEAFDRSGGCAGACRRRCVCRGTVVRAARRTRGIVRERMCVLRRAVARAHRRKYALFGRHSLGGLPHAHERTPLVSSKAAELRGIFWFRGPFQGHFETKTFLGGFGSREREVLAFGFWVTPLSFSCAEKATLRSPRCLARQPLSGARAPPQRTPRQPHAPRQRPRTRTSCWRASIAKPRCRFKHPLLLRRLLLWLLRLPMLLLRTAATCAAPRGAATTHSPTRRQRRRSLCGHRLRP